MSVLSRCVQAQKSEILAFCADRPERTTFIAGWVAEGGLRRAPGMPLGWLLAEYDDNKDICGLALATDVGIVLPALTSDRARHALIDWTAPTPDAVRVLVGERAEVSQLWRILKGRGARSRLIRDQSGYIVDRASFVPHTEPASLRVATRLDSVQVVQASAAMAREEAGDDPQGRNPKLFAERIVERIKRNRDFVLVNEGRVQFKANVATISSVAGQVEGIFTQPEFRGRGLGSRGTSAVTAWVLERSPRAFLLVNDDNEPARRVYERLGYRHVVDSQTIFAEP